MTSKWTTGYEDREDNTPDLPDPHGRNWTLERAHVGVAYGNAEYANVLLDGEVIGAIRFPDKDHFEWFRKLLSRMYD